MENSAEGGMTDLLSAALSESGLDGDFFDSSDSGISNVTSPPAPNRILTNPTTQAGQTVRIVRTPLSNIPGQVHIQGQAGANILGTPVRTVRVQAPPSGAQQRIITTAGGQQRIITTPGGQQRIINTGGQQRIVTTADGQQRIVTTAGGQHRIITTSDGQQRLVTTGGQQRIITTADGQQRIVTTAGGQQRIVTTADGQQRIVSTGGGPQRIVTTADGQQRIVTTTGGQQRILTTVDGQQRIVTTGGQQRILTAAGGQQRIVTTGGAQRIVTTAGQQRIVTTVGGQQRLVTVSSANPVTAAGQQRVINNTVTTAGQQRVITNAVTAAGQQRVITNAVTAAGQHRVITNPVTTAGQQRVITNPVTGQTQTVRVVNAKPVLRTVGQTGIPQGTKIVRVIQRPAGKVGVVSDGVSTPQQVIVSSGGQSVISGQAVSAVQSVGSTQNVTVSVNEITSPSIPLTTKPLVIRSSTPPVQQVTGNQSAQSIVNHEVVVSDSATLPVNSITNNKPIVIRTSSPSVESGKQTDITTDASHVRSGQSPIGRAEIPPAESIKITTSSASDTAVAQGIAQLGPSSVADLNSQVNPVGTAQESQHSLEAVSASQASSETIVTGQVSSETIVTGQVSSETVPSAQVSSETILSGQVSSQTTPDSQVSSEPSTVLQGTTCINDQNAIQNKTNESSEIPEDVAAASSSVPSSDNGPDHGQPGMAESCGDSVTASANTDKSSASDDQKAPPGDEKNKEEAPSMMGGFGDMELDFFSALQQLTATNKEAAEFEAKHKQDTVASSPSDSPKCASPLTTREATPPLRTQSPLVTSQSSAVAMDTSDDVILTGVSPAMPGGNMAPGGVTVGGSLMPGGQYITSMGTPASLTQPANTMSQPGIATSLLGGQAVKIINPTSNILQQSGNQFVKIQRIPSGSSLLQKGQRIVINPTAGSSMPGSLTLTPGGNRVTIQPPGKQIVVTPKIMRAGSVPSGLSNKVLANTMAMSPALMAAKQNSPVNSRSSSPTNGIIKTQLTDKDVSRLWANDDLKLKKIVSDANNSGRGSPISVLPSISHMSSAPLIDEVEEEDEELGHAETYADYIPSKLKIGEKHPDSVVETSSLSSVEPPDVWYKLSIPESTIDYGYLSALQLESITYTSQKHEIILPSGERAGYLIGDGAGVGKGRTIAGIIFENYLLGRKRSLWLSVSNDLRVDAERDLRDIGAAKIEVHPLNKFKYAKISSHINGSVKKGVVFSTYSALIGESQSGGKYRTRFKQLLHWMGKDFDGVIVFDECHKAKNLCPVGSSKPTKTGQTVLDLQKRLPKARIVYASATGASEPRNMAYMTRLGLWGVGTPFREFNDFIQAIEKRGVGAMELVAMDMKLRGMYIARQLSFHGVTFRIEEIPIPKDFIKIYNEAVRLWVDAREKFQRSADLIDAEHRMKKTMWGQFWSAHQRFFKYLCISAKVRHCVKLAREAVKNGKCVVIGLQSTGEARTLEAVEEMGGELTDFVSTAKGVFQTLVEKHFPAPDRRKTMSDLFGWSNIFGDSPSSSPKPGSKRKRNSDKGKKNKKAKKYWYANSSGEDFSDTSEDTADEKEKDEEGSEKEQEESELSMSESSEEEEDDDFNPFGNGSDSDDDPWLKKSKNKKKKPPKEKKKEKKKKEKKEKKKKEKKEKKKSKDKADDDDDSDEDFDDQFDKALSAAGLMGGGSNSGTSKKNMPGMDAVDQAILMKKELLMGIDRLGDVLPPNTLDELIDQLGGTENVAEMTGRKGRVVANNDGSIQYESRSEVDAPLEILNLTEKQRFMDGEKNIAIISEAASSGISLQADRRAVNQRRRVHITLELPWSADRAIQQFGRTHRSNQVSAPEYVFMISELAGEQRFASTVAKRLESLGALTHGDRRATESRDLSRFNIDNKYGRAALESVMKSVLGHERSLVQPPGDYVGNFYEDVKVGLVGVGLISVDNGYASLEKDYNNISKFLNRILGMPCALQNSLFKYFTDTLTSIILQAKRYGRWDMGILDLGSGQETVRKINSKNFVSNFGGANVRTQLHTVAVERGMTWQKAMTVWQDNSGSDDGFYLSSQARNDKKTAILAVQMSTKKSRDRLFKIYRPNTGLQLRAESLQELKQKYRKTLPDGAEPFWQDQYSVSATVCTHAYWRGNCKRSSVGLVCEVGLRSRTYYVLSGSVLGCWNKVESVLASLPGGNASRMQIIRLKCDDGSRIVGTLIPEHALQPLTVLLSENVAVKEVRPVQQFPQRPLQAFSATLNSPFSRSQSSPHLVQFAGSPPSSPSLSGYGAAASPQFRTVTTTQGTPQVRTMKVAGPASGSPLFRTVTSVPPSGVAPQFKTVASVPQFRTVSTMPQFKTVTGMPQTAEPQSSDNTSLLSMPSFF